jgi:hypothetical protein
MYTYRLGLILIRLVIASVAAFYGLLKLVFPEASPLFSVPREVAVTLQSPYYTNKNFAIALIVLNIAIAVLIVVITSRDLYSDFRKFGHAAPFSRPSIIMLMAVFAMAAVYYLTVAVTVGAPYFYTSTLAFIATALALYEGKQYADK